MTRLTIALVACAVTAACSAGNKGGATAGTGGDPALPPKKLLLSWGISQEGELSDVFLATTDEPGKQVNHQVGRYKGMCAPIAPAREMTALTGVACVTGGGGGTELHAVRRGGEIVVVQLSTAPGVAPDPMAREEDTRIAIPTGAGVEVAP